MAIGIGAPATLAVFEGIRKGAVYVEVLAIGLGDVVANSGRLPIIHRDAPAIWPAVRWLHVMLEACIVVLCQSGRIWQLSVVRGTRFFAVGQSTRQLIPSSLVSLTSFSKGL